MSSTDCRFLRRKVSFAAFVSESMSSRVDQHEKSIAITLRSEGVQRYNAGARITPCSRAAADQSQRGYNL